MALSRAAQAIEASGILQPRPLSAHRHGDHRRPVRLLPAARGADRAGPEEAEATALRTDIIDALTDAVGETRVEQFTADNERLDLLLLFPALASPEEVRDALADVDLAGGRVQATTAGSFKIRVQEPDDGDIQALRTLVEDALRSGVGPMRVLQGASKQL